MLTISKKKADDRGVTLRLEGWVMGPWVKELRLLCEQILTAGGPLTLDTREVSFVDEEGIVLLEGLGRQVSFVDADGREVKKCSVFRASPTLQASSYCLSLNTEHS
jgi:hypothetical protein